jgi:hypothetical protein
MFALLHCQGLAEDKIESFYSILQDGGIEAHAQISASDKDFPLVITEMANIVLGDIIHFSELPAKYTAEEVAKVAETIETFVEESILEPIFGELSREEAAVFMKKTVQHCSWLFNAEQFRLKLLAKAGLDQRY